MSGGRRRLAVGMSLAVLLCAPDAWSALPPPKPSLIAAVDQLVAEKGITPETPGVAVMVIQPGRWMFQKGYGLARLQPRVPVTPHTLFELASVSKPFTSTAVLMLQERGKLSVQDDVRQYLPELPAYHKQRISIANLLHHTSGLPDYMSFEEVPRRNTGYWVNADYVPEFARQRKSHPLEFPTNQQYSYNNTNYMLLAVIVQRVSQKSYGKFLRDEIFGPAGMQHTFAYESPDAVPSAGPAHAIGYTKAKRGWKPAWGLPPERQEEMLTVGDGGIWTNLDDMARWDAALRAHRLITAATMQQALVPSRTLDGETNDYGFGWSIYPAGKGLQGYGHEGEWGGFNTSYYRYLTQDRTTVLLSNNGDFDPDEFWYALNAAIEKHEPREE